MIRRTSLAGVAAAAVLALVLITMQAVSAQEPELGGPVVVTPSPTVTPSETTARPEVSARPEASKEERVSRKPPARDDDEDDDD